MHTRETLNQIAANKVELNRALDQLAEEASLAHIESLGKSYRTRVYHRMTGAEEGTQNLHRTFDLAFTEEGEKLWKKRLKATPEFRMLVNGREIRKWDGVKSFTAEQAIYLYQVYGPVHKHSDDRRAGMLDEVSERN